MVLKGDHCAASYQSLQVSCYEWLSYRCSGAVSNYLPKRWGGLVLSADSPSEDLIKVINLPKRWGDLMLSVDSPPEETIESYLKFVKALGCPK